MCINKNIFSIACVFLFLLSNMVMGLEKNNDAVKKQILDRLDKWPDDFNKKKLTEVCSLFASDLVATYPGTADRNYEAICNQFKELFADTTTTITYDKPKVEQIIIDEDLAVVRLIWTQKTLADNQSTATTERGLDVFRKQKDGSWKISVSYAYPGKPIN